MVLQRMQVYEATEDYKREASFRLGRRRYKHIILFDLHGWQKYGMSLFFGGLKGILKEVFGLGAQYYPEAMLRM